jgi:hypothetical protein
LLHNTQSVIQKLSFQSNSRIILPKSSESEGVLESRQFIEGLLITVYDQQRNEEYLEDLQGLHSQHLVEGETGRKDQEGQQAQDEEYLPNNVVELQLN